MKRKICHCIGARPAIKPVMGEGDILIAVDGGYEQILHWGLVPDRVVGDFDSLGYVPTGDNVEQLPCRKDETDMAVAISLGKSLGADCFYLQGGLGGRLDHSVANFQLLQALAEEGRWGILFGEGQCVTVLSTGSLQFPDYYTGYLSLFALGGEATGITLDALSYTGEQLCLSPNFPLGVSNEFLKGQSGKISLGSGTLLVIWQEQCLEEGLSPFQALGDIVWENCQGEE